MSSLRGYFFRLVSFLRWGLRIFLCSTRGFVGFLFFYGILKLREAHRGVEVSFESKSTTTVRQTILTSLGFSLLNPHVYLDTVVLIGGYSSQFGQSMERLYFGAGASTFSTLWFFGLTLLASLGSRLFGNPKVMRIVSFIFRDHPRWPCFEVRQRCLGMDC